MPFLPPNRQRQSTEGNSTNPQQVEAVEFERTSSCDLLFLGDAGDDAARHAAVIGKVDIR